MKEMQTSVLGEGNTPMTRSMFIEKRLGIKQLWLKNEGLNPSGSFKDRESAFIFSQLKKSGTQSVSIASSGNAAISACLYGKRFKMTVHFEISTKDSGSEPVSCFLCLRSDK